MKILVVDDNEYIQELVKNYLRDEPFEVEVRSDVATAIEALDSGGDFSLVITDIVMPEVDGTKLAQYVKSQNPAMPVIAITGGVENAREDYMNYAEMFADVTMGKPLKKDELIATIKRLVA